MSASVRLTATTLSLATFLALSFLLTAPLRAQEMPKPPKNAWVYMKSPQNGATVKSPVQVVMRVVGMSVQPAGAVTAGTGHHHLIIDDTPPPAGTAVAADATHVHFGKGQTEATLELSPGLHTITAQFADGVHRSYGAQLAHTIIIRVE